MGIIPLLMALLVPMSETAIEKMNAQNDKQAIAQFDRESDRLYSDHALTIGEAFKLEPIESSSRDKRLTLGGY